MLALRVSSVAREQPHANFHRNFFDARRRCNAADTLPDVMEHLEMAKQQYAMLTSGAPPAK
jgi:hypothetical protein